MTHLVIEPFGVSMFRNLPRVHPVFKLLCPHLRYTMAINTIGRAKLVGDQGLADQVLSIGRGGHIVYIKSRKRVIFNCSFFDFFPLKDAIAISISVVSAFPTT